MDRRNRIKMSFKYIINVKKQKNFVRILKFFQLKYILYYSLAFRVLRIPSQVGAHWVFKNIEAPRRAAWTPTDFY